jgi:hypothetical protein
MVKVDLETVRMDVCMYVRLVGAWPVGGVFYSCSFLEFIRNRSMRDERELQK